MVTGILAFFGWQRFRAPAAPNRVAIVTGLPARSVSNTTPGALAAAPAATALPQADSLIEFAMRQLGSPYTYAGTTPTGGFDCSGFLMYVYGHFGVSVPHSTALLIDTGRPVAREEARRGDMVIFTGTAATSTTPGHAGIIISHPGEPLRFIHSSSARRASGVKVSQVEGTDYERRFMGIRRVLGVEESKPAAEKSTVKTKVTTKSADAPATKVKTKVKTAAGSSGGR
ncbi:C40 family peptidase [Hymenobacter sp. BT635]|uniref:C40 family peptidase n=1 Tax=Hymenobacter nitidus TaxID=2880929 RepID=A0ABS8AA91_9BACT|nr:C40 family peptidase [Hymenobacter nitidus]MCB2376867.1 C40 family peptidase [Hymenobacter nitidus]